MPMKKGYGKKTVSKNIKNEMKSGKPQRQAVAMAMDSARRSKKPKGTLE
jgi:ornithine cyclodeaminase/alanine dehydrogenase-like protein (mu-crystallin family)